MKMKREVTITEENLVEDYIDAIESIYYINCGLLMQDTDKMFLEPTGDLNYRYYCAIISSEKIALSIRSVLTSDEINTLNDYITKILKSEEGNDFNIEILNDVFGYLDSAFKDFDKPSITEHLSNYITKIKRINSHIKYNI